MKEESTSKDFKNKINQSGFNPKSQKNEVLTKKKRISSYKKESVIPKNVANRMARRIAFTTGFPTLCGMSVFIISYYLITNGIADVAPTITLLTSGACFLIGLLGLSYGILSASWEEENGSFVGLENIRPNIKRVKEAFSSKELS